MLFPFWSIIDFIYPSFTELKSIQKVTNRKTEESVKINTTLPKMEDLNFSNPLKNGIHLSFLLTAFLNGSMNEKKIHLFPQFTLKISIRGQQILFYFLDQRFPGLAVNAIG
jgi:hypothetical protein